MAAIKLRYVRNKRGNLFWEPTPTMRALGFLPKPLGPDAPPAWAEAQSLYEKWLRTRSRRSGDLLASRGIVPNASVGSRFVQ